MKAKWTLLFVVVFLHFFFSKCSNPDVRSDYTVTKLPDVVNVQSRHLKTSSKLLSVSSLVIYDNMLVALNNSQDDHMFHIFNLTDGKFLGSIEGYGKGPEEFTRVNTRCFGVRDSSLYLYDIVRKRLSFFKIAFDNVVSLKKIRSIDIPGKFDIINGLFYSERNNALIGHAVGIYENNNNTLKEEYFAYNTSNDTINQFSPYPSFLGKEVNPHSEYLLYLKRIVPKPDGSKFAALYSNFGVVKIYDLPGFSLMNESLVDLPKIETIEVENSGEVNMKGHYVYYNYTYATDQYFYGLYFGKKKEELKTMAKKDGGQEIIPEIHVWDWEGNCVARIQPDNPISTFAVSKNDEMIYGINPFNTDIIHSFSLNEILKQL